MICEECKRHWDDHDWFTPPKWEKDPNSAARGYKGESTAWLPTGQSPLESPQCRPPLAGKPEPAAA